MRGDTRRNHIAHPEWKVERDKVFTLCGLVCTPHVVFTLGNQIATHIDVNCPTCLLVQLAEEVG